MLNTVIAKYILSALIYIYPVFKNLLIIFFCLFSVLAAHGQQTVFSGRVFENKTRIPLSGVQIENLSSHLKSITGSDGRFGIAAKVGDLLVFKDFSYQRDTLLLTDMHEREVFLSAQATMLNQVTITDTNGHTSSADKNMILPYDPEFHGQTMVYHRDKNGDYDGGAILRLHYFKGDEHKKKAAQQKEEDRQLSLEISTIFTADNIGHYIPLKGAELDSFVLMYTPDIKVYNTKDFNLLSYLNTCYQAWLKLPEDKRHGGDIFKKQ